MTPEQWEEIKPYIFPFLLGMLIGCFFILGGGE
jgi:hypothetical protein